MTNFSQKIARIFLLFYCLTPHTYTRCENNYEKKVTRRSPPATNKLTGIFAEIERIKDKGDKHPSVTCGAAWIDTNFLITAASCLEIMHTRKTEDSKKKKPIQTTVKILGTTEDPWKIATERKTDVAAKMQRIYDVNVIPMVEKKNQFYIRKDSEPLKGKAKIHPLFRRSNLDFSNGMPIGFDVAVVKADPRIGEYHENGLLCPPEASYPSTFTLLYAAKNGKVYEWQYLNRYTDGGLKRIDVGFFKSEKVVIDPDHQFTTYRRKMPNETLIAGLPILTYEKVPIRCIAGISNFHGQQRYIHWLNYITSTNVSTLSIQDWIKHAKDWLTKPKNPKGNEKYGENWWKKEEENTRFVSERIIMSEALFGQRTYPPAGLEVEKIRDKFGLENGLDINVV